MAGSLMPVSGGRCGKMISHAFEWAFLYQFLSAAAQWIGINNIFLLQPLKPVFCYLKRKFPLNLKIKYQRYNAKERPFDL
jgi:hypothetical protein